VNAEDETIALVVLTTAFTTDDLFNTVFESSDEQKDLE
jgi:hypothetical protein